MLASLLGQSADFVNTSIDWHAIAPEVVLAGVALLIVLADSVFLERARPFIPGLAGLGFLAALIPVLTLAMSSTCLLYTSPSPRDRTRSRMPSSD